MSAQAHHPYIVTQKNKTINFWRYPSLYILQKKKNFDRPHEIYLRHFFLEERGTHELKQAQ